MVQSIKRFTFIKGLHYRAYIDSYGLETGTDMLLTLSVYIEADNGREELFKFEGNILELQNDLHHNELIEFYSSKYGENIASEVWLNILTV